MPAIDYIWNDKHIDIMLKNKDDDKTVRDKNIAGFFKGIDVEGLGHSFVCVHVWNLSCWSDKLKEMRALNVWQELYPTL